jgi:hypothetical protein
LLLCILTGASETSLIFATRIVNEVKRVNRIVYEGQKGRSARSFLKNYVPRQEQSLGAGR